MAADLGLFGPDTVTWRVHADPVMGLGGVRALLLQALHPLAIIGVAEHSGFRSDFWGRIMRTVRYVAVTTYGTSEEAHQAAARVRRVHTFVRGVDPQSGLAYRADDPDLLLWVHCCEVDSVLCAYRRCGGALRPGEDDAYVAEQVRMAPLVGLDPALAPATVAELRDYFRQVRPQLRVTREARTMALYGLAAPMPAWVQLLTPARPAWTGVVALGFGLLPRWARRMYGLPGLSVTDPLVTVAGHAMRRTLLAVPPDVRHGPAYKAAVARLRADPPPVRRLAALPGERR